MIDPREVVPERPPTVSVSLEMKINLGNYESASVFVAASGLQAGASQAEIDELLDTGRLAYDRIKERIRAKVVDIRYTEQNKSLPRVP